MKIPYMNKTYIKKNKGNVGDIMTTGLCVLAVAAIAVAYFNCMELIQQKTQAGQLARKYILRMETVGCLDNEGLNGLVQELEGLGITDISLENTTTEPVGYGQGIELDIRGKLKGEYEFYEHRVSTAKY
jgi:hypothetical protein